MYTICTKEEWRSKYFDPQFCEVVYGVFFTYKQAKARAEEIDGIVIQLTEDRKKTMLTR